MRATVLAVPGTAQSRAPGAPPADGLRLPTAPPLQNCCATLRQREQAVSTTVALDALESPLRRRAPGCYRGCARKLSHVVVARGAASTAVALNQCSDGISTASSRRQR